MITVRKPNISILALITLLFVAFLMGYFLGLNQRKSQITVSVSKEMTIEPQEVLQMETVDVITDSSDMATEYILPVAINHAGIDLLTTLPGIGISLAQNIIAYRETHGDFTSIEDLLNVEGIGQKRLDEIQDYIVIGG